MFEEFDELLERTRTLTTTITLIKLKINSTLFTLPVTYLHDKRLEPTFALMAPEFTKRRPF